MNTVSNFDPSGTLPKRVSQYSYVPPKNASLENHLAQHLKKITRIGAALSIEKDIHKLLEMIVDEAKSLTNADAGTLYILDKEKQTLQFQILQNDSMGVRLGGTSGVEITLPDVPLFDSREPGATMDRPAIDPSQCWCWPCRITKTKPSGCFSY